MRAFIVRPFGVKNGIDFDGVEKKLIAPALVRLEIAGRSTLEILEQGNIRIDMFQKLLTADLVIADVSIHNANVFYELGIRHALRGKHTFMISSKVDAHPFDLQTDRYLRYDPNNPEATLETLVAALRESIDSEKNDSPVFQVLPDLQEQDKSRFLPVPIDFRMEVENAISEKEYGDLELFTHEVKDFPWETEALRMIGSAQFDLNANESACKTWEAIRFADNSDLEANLNLATIYQRLGNLDLSNQALRLALARKDLTDSQRAEARALLGSNTKELWKAAWMGKEQSRKRECALSSPFLASSFEEYQMAFFRDLNHFYSGLNALAMLTILVELATSMPEVWQGLFESPEDAPQELKSKKDQRARLAGAVEISLIAAKRRNEVDQKNDVWLDISFADFRCLTSRNPKNVAFSYKNAIPVAAAFKSGSIRRQLKIYSELEVLKENSEAALAELPQEKVEKPKEDKLDETILLFTGHMIDSPDREKPPNSKKPRFPNDAELIKKARESIKNAITKEMKPLNPIRFGIAGGANGGDILFHEVCAELGIKTKLFLCFPRDKFVSKSVSPAGPEWVTKFDVLYQSLEKKVLIESKELAKSEELPRWLRAKKDYDIWERNNLWMLYNATAEEKSNVTLIALWDGEKEGEGPGGTYHLVQEANEEGAKIILLNTKEIFNFA